MINKRKDKSVKLKFDQKYFSSGSYKNYKKEVDRWVPYVAWKISKIVRKLPAKALDVGCAHGYLIAELQNKHNFSVSGIDPSLFAIKNSEPSVRKKISRGNILDLPFGKNKFDVVICLGVINYLKSSDETFAAIKNLVNVSKKYIFFDAIFKNSWTASQKHNPDKLRNSALSKKEYVDIFRKNGVKLAQIFDGRNGGTILVFEKYLKS
ncbi:MAG: class I SAM-dependent methyltransferase [bacterium]|nr:class I SAM-dependent methyltransferase [bacterium]